MIGEPWVTYFMMYSILGWLYETILCSVVNKKYINRGFLKGPYCPIYGMGAVINILLLGELSDPVQLFILGLLFTCTLEYITSFFMEELFHERWWDYSTKKFNINGRVCLLGGVVFGLFSVVLIIYIHPMAYQLLSSIPMLLKRILSTTMVCVFVIDSMATMNRYYQFDNKISDIFQELSIGKNKVTSKIIQYRKNISEKITEHEMLSKIYHVSIGKLNYQDRRISDVFPYLKSLKYSDIVSNLKRLLDKKNNED